MMEITISPDTVYLCNPDVVLREEDQEGALLFNPDTNQVKVINPTGLFIWNQFTQANTPSTVAAQVLQAFEGATEDQIYTDLEAFIQELHRTGFLGLVEDPAA